MANIKSIVENLSNAQKIKAIGYRVPDEPYFSLTGPKSYFKAFHMMTNVLAGVEAVMAVEEDTPNSKIPNVDTAFIRGDEIHANEVCATLEQVEEDIFATHDNGVTFFAIGADADDLALSRLLA